MPNNPTRHIQVLQIAAKLQNIQRTTYNMHIEVLQTAAWLRSESSLKGPKTEGTTWSMEGALVSVLSPQSGAERWWCRVQKQTKS